LLDQGIEFLKMLDDARDQLSQKGLPFGRERLIFQPVSDRVARAMIGCV
jgi:hypothetical protein